MLYNTTKYIYNWEEFLVRYLDKPLARQNIFSIKMHL